MEETVVDQTDAIAITLNVMVWKLAGALGDIDENEQMYLLDNVPGLADRLIVERDRYRDALAQIPGLLEQVVGEYEIHPHRDFEGWVATMKLVEVYECMQQDGLSGPECPVCTMGVHSLDQQMLDALQLAVEVNAT